MKVNKGPLVQYVVITQQPPAMSTIRSETSYQISLIFLWPVFALASKYVRGRGPKICA